MKQAVIILLAIVIMAPAVSFAGTASSRWDVTIGGVVKFDMGYNTQAQGVDAWSAARSGNGPYDSATDRYGNFFSSGGETRMNFLVKGPDGWGAKTSAFIEGEFRGFGVSNGGFTMRHAFMALDWPMSKLLIGHTWQKWGFLPTFSGAILGYNNIGPTDKGNRQPLIRFEQKVGNNWNWALGVISASNTVGATTSTNYADSFTLSGMPFIEGSLGWTTDKCGKIGNWQMLFALEGFYGQQKQIQQLNIVSGGVLQSTSFTSDNVNSYGIALKGFIPIIPEKKGNRKGALSTSGMLFYAQNPSWLLALTTPGSYAMTNTIDPSYHAPVMYGGWGQLSYFIKDDLFVNGYYGYARNNLSNYYMNSVASGNQIQNTTQIVANIMYDLNAAMRFGFEYCYYTTRYASPGTVIAGVPTTQKDGAMSVFRIGAMYFF